MTKTYTEQWREGTLKSGNYYTVCYKGWSGETFHCNLYYSERIGFDANVKEIIAPVPSYEEYKDLYDSNKQIMTHIKTCEQQIERLQEQLNEANKLILWCAGISWTGDQREDIFDKYLAKWGIK